MKKKVMTNSSLENMMTRLSGCLALLRVLYASAGTSVTSEEELEGVCDLLESIRKDFQADIDAAEDYTGKAAAV